MNTYNTFVYDIFLKTFDKIHSIYMNRHKFYTIDRFTLTSKRLYPIIHLLSSNTFKKDLDKDIIVRYTLIAMCSVLNEKRETLDALKKDIYKGFNERFIEDIRLSILVILNFYKIVYDKECTYEDILKDTRNFIALTVVLYEFIKQNNFTFKVFLEKYQKIDDNSLVISKIRTAIENINRNSK